MNLTELTEEFVEATGRVDFDEPTVLKYLNRGCKFLDELLLGLEGDTKEYLRLIEGNNFVVSHRLVRVVTEVHVYSDTKQIPLKYIPLETMREFYKEEGVANGEPQFYSFAPIRLIGTNDNAQQSVQGIWAATPGNDDDAGKGIMIYPPADRDYHMELTGSFYTPPLRTDNQTNKWTMQHPELVIQAAIYRMDNNYRNTQAGKDLIESITNTIRSIYYDSLEFDLKRSRIMEG